MTVPLLIDSFQEAAADNVTNCDLAAKVYAATQLPSLSTWPTRDIRCEGGVPGTLLVLRMDILEGETVLEIDIPFNKTEGLINPYEKLKEGYDAWREENSCVGPHGGISYKCFNYISD
jgi:hypothetical protein